MSGYDYTLDDFGVDESPEEIGGYEPMPLGWQKLRILSWEIKPKSDKVRDAYLPNGQRITYRSPSISFKLGLASNPASQTYQTLTLPPKSAAEMVAFKEGAATPGAKKFGTNYKKLIQFINAAGFDLQPGRPIPPEARNFDNYKGRELWGKIILGDPRDDGRQFPEVDMFGFKGADFVPPADNGAGAGTGTATQGGRGGGSNGHAAAGVAGGSAGATDADDSEIDDVI